MIEEELGMTATIEAFMAKKGPHASKSAGKPRARASGSEQKTPILLTQSEEILAKLKAGTVAVLDSLGQTFARGVDICKYLNLDTTLGWNIYRVATAPDPLSVGPHVPTPATMRRFLEAAQDKGVPPQTIANLRHVFTAFEDFAARHAPDRAAFISMIRDLQGGQNTVEDIKHRRAAFRANRHLLGIHADALLSLKILGPLSAERTYSQITVRGWINIQRGRSITNVLSRQSMKLETTASKSQPQQIPLDAEELSMGGFSLLRRFSSASLPEFRVSEEDGVLYTEAVTNELGSDAAFTYFLGGIVHNISDQHPHHPSHKSWRVHNTIPTEVFQLDFWLHESVWPVVRPLMELYYPRALRSMVLSPLPDELLPMNEQMEFLGTGVRAASTNDVPRYTEMVCYIAEKQGWRIEDFRLFRCSVPYPILGSVLCQVMLINEHAPMAPDKRSGLPSKATLSQAAAKGG